jgi:hypothetical protein
LPVCAPPINGILVLFAVLSLYVVSAGTFKQFMRARNRVGIGLSYRPARLHSLSELVHRNRFLGSLKVKKIRAQFPWRAYRIEHRVLNDL